MRSLSHLSTARIGLGLFALTLTPALASPYSGVVAFGDSLTDQGNTISYFPPPDWEGTTGYDERYYNAAYNSYGVVAEGRWSSGATWIEYLHGNLQTGTTGSAPIALGKNYGIGLLESDLSAGTNFAYGGSTTSTGTTKVFIDNLRSQVASYSSLINNSESALYNYSVSTALHSVWSGGNDAIYWIEETETDRDPVETVTTTSANNIHAAVTSLYATGARHFLIPNLPDLSKKPNYIDDPTLAALALSFVDLFNTKLANVILDLEADLDEISISFFDVRTRFDELLENYESYGFTNSDEAAYTYTGGDPTSIIVDNPETYVFWDYTHPTTQMHQILGDFAYLNFAPIPEGSHVALLLTGGAALLFFRSRRREKRAA